MINPTVAALTFVVIWSTGFIVARGIAPHADPNLFLSVRFACCALIFASLAIVMKLAWPGRRVRFQLLGIGALIQGLYLGAGFWAVGEGLQPGVMALMGTLQPPLTAAIASRYFDERMSAVGWIGLLLGVTGVALTVWPEGSQQTLQPMIIVAGLISVLAITAGTLLQKSAVSSVHLIPSSAIQNMGAMITTICLALVLRESVFQVNATSLALLGYAVLVLSLGGTTLLLWMVRSGSVTRSTSLFFLVPPLATIMAYLVFDEKLGVRQTAGFVVALVGVVLTRRDRAIPR